MPILKRKNKEVSPEQKEAALLSAPRKMADISRVLLKPRVTEKSASRNDQGVYVFDVNPKANVYLVKEAVRQYFKVTPLKVNIVSIPVKTVFIRGKMGEKGGGKKAYVYLAKGEKIEIA